MKRICLEFVTEAPKKKITRENLRNASKLYSYIRLIRKADNIVVIDHGNIAEQGTHDQLGV